MAKILKPYEVPLDAELAEEILAIPVDGAAPAADHPRTIGERVGEAVSAVEQANEYLASSKLASLVADTLMRRLKKRGNPSIRVKPDGVVVLHISYDEPAATRAVPPVDRPKRKSTLPPITELRERAAELGVDISDLGRKRKLALERIEAAEEAAAAGIRPATSRRRVIRRREGVEDVDVGDILSDEN